MVTSTTSGERARSSFPSTTSWPYEALEYGWWKTLLKAKLAQSLHNFHNEDYSHRVEWTIHIGVESAKASCKAPWSTTVVYGGSKESPLWNGRCLQLLFYKFLSFNNYLPPPKFCYTAAVLFFFSILIWLNLMTAYLHPSFAQKYIFMLLPV